MDKQTPQDLRLAKLINGPFQPAQNMAQGTENPATTEPQPDIPTPIDTSSACIAAANEEHLKTQTLKDEADKIDRWLCDQKADIAKEAADLIQKIHDCQLQQLAHRSMLRVTEDGLRKLASHLAPHYTTDRMWTAFQNDQMKSLHNAESAAAHAAICRFQERQLGDTDQLPGHVIQAVTQARADYLSTSSELAAALEEIVGEINQTYFAQEERRAYSDRMYLTATITSAQQHRHELMELLLKEQHFLQIAQHSLDIAEGKMDDIAAQRQLLYAFLQHENVATQPASNSEDEHIQSARDTVSSPPPLPQSLELAAPIREVKASMKELNDSFGQRLETLTSFCDSPAPPFRKDEDEESDWSLVSYGRSNDSLDNVHMANILADIANAAGSDQESDLSLVSDIHSDRSTLTNGRLAEQLSDTGDAAPVDMAGTEGMDTDELSNQMLHLQPQVSLWDSAASGLP